MGVTEPDDGGYDVEETYLITWEKRPGAWMRARSLGTGEMLARNAELNALREKAEADGDREAKTRLTFEHAAGLLADVIVGWNMRRRGEALPITYESMMLLSDGLLLDAYKAYMTGNGEVGEGSDLGKDSPSGGSYPAELQAMEVLSPSPSS